MWQVTDLIKEPFLCVFAIGPVVSPLHMGCRLSRVLATISKIPVQSSIYKSQPVHIELLSFFRHLHQLYLVFYCVKKGNLFLSHVLEEGLLGIDVVINPKKTEELKLLRTTQNHFLLDLRWTLNDLQLGD